MLQAENFDPETWTLYSYAAVQVIKQAAEAAHSLEPTAIAKVMHSAMVFKTMTGDVTFDKKGDANSICTMYIWKKGPDGRGSYYELGK